MSESFFKFIASRLPTYAVCYPNEFIAWNSINFRCKFRISTSNLIEFRATTSVKIGFDKIRHVFRFYNEIKSFIVGAKSFNYFREVSIIHLLFIGNIILIKNISYKAFHYMAASVFTSIGVKPNLNTKYIVNKILDLFFLENLCQTCIIKEFCNLLWRCEII